MGEGCVAGARPQAVPLCGTAGTPALFAECPGSTSISACTSRAVALSVSLGTLQSLPCKVLICAAFPQARHASPFLRGVCGLPFFAEELYKICKSPFQGRGAQHSICWHSSALGSLNGAPVWGWQGCHH